MVDVLTVRYEIEKKAHGQNSNTEFNLTVQVCAEHRNYMKH